MLLIKEIATALDTAGVVADIDRIVWQEALDILRND
jgi:hypothetical protein